MNICEGIWFPEGPAQLQALVGEAEVIVNISASPYYQAKGAFRERMFATRAADNLVIVAAVNMVGGQDELVFDGPSVVVDQHGAILARGRQFTEELLLVDLDVDAVFQSRLHDTRRRKKKLAMLEQFGVVDRFKMPAIRSSKPRPPWAKRPVVPSLAADEEVYLALVTGVRDYVAKNGFETVVIGLSGGVDSAQTATIATDALGASRVVGAFMPSPYTAAQSREDTEQLVHNLGIRLITLPIHIDRAPTAELKPSQRDQDTLPPYDVLDPILKAYVEEDKALESIVAMGYAKKTVEAVACMVDHSEYKRRQAPIGIKLTPRALGKDRRMPVTNRYRER